MSNGGFPSRYTGDEDAAKIYADMAPKAGGIGAGTLVQKATDAGYRGGIDGTPGVKIFAHAIGGAAANANGAIQSLEASPWTFGLHDPVADATLPPIKYRDPLKLWPDSPEGTVTQVIAGPKCHKTNFIMQQMFHLMRSGGARVLMLALEGGYGVRTMRLKALAAHNDFALADLRGRFQVANIKSGGMFDLSDPDCVGAFVAWLKGSVWTDVVIDTQHRAAGALEENSATDARRLWNAVEFIRHQARCNVVLAHHQGKDASKGGRGSSADLASVDQQIELSFDRGTMTVTAKVTARKDGVDGFAVPFKVLQPNEAAVPILEPISAAEFDALTVVQDRITPAAIGAALKEMKCIGRDHACTTRVLASQMLVMRDELPKDAERAEKAIANLQNRLLERAVKDRRIAPYGRKDGGHRTAPWVWYLPGAEGEDSDV